MEEEFFLKLITPEANHKKIYDELCTHYKNLRTRNSLTSRLLKKILEHGIKLDWIGLGTWGVFTSPMGNPLTQY